MRTIACIISLLLLFSLNNLQAQKKNKHLICHYKFDNNPNDNSSNNNNGKIEGNVTATENRFGIKCTAYKFDGKTGYIKISDNKALEKIKNILTITVWAKLDPQSKDKWFSICCKADTKNENFSSPHFRLQLSEKQFSLSTFITTENKQTFDKGKWYFLAVSVSETNEKLYINGNLVLNKKLEEKLEPNKQALLIGRDMPGKDEFFHGSMDDLRIYDKELSEKEINKIFKDKSDKNIKSPCASPIDSIPIGDSIPVTVKCNSVVKSGGNEISIKKMDLGKTSGKFTLFYNMFTVPDRLTIFSAKDNSIIYTTKKFVKDYKTIEIDYKDTRFILIKVEGNGKKKTKWNYKITCEDQ